MNIELKRWPEEQKPSAEVLHERFRREGYSVMEWSDAPGTIYPLHEHSEDQSHWIVSGALELTVAGQTYTLYAGDRDFLPAHTSHAAFVPGREPVRYLIGVKRS